MIASYLNSWESWTSTPHRHAIDPEYPNFNQQAPHSNNDPSAPKTHPEHPQKPNVPGRFPDYHHPPPHPSSSPPRSHCASESTLPTIHELPAHTYHTSIRTPSLRSWPEYTGPPHAHRPRLQHGQIPPQSWFNWITSRPDSRVQDRTLHMHLTHARNGRAQLDYFTHCAPYIGGYIAPATDYHAAMEGKLHQNSLWPSPGSSPMPSQFSGYHADSEESSLSSGGTRTRGGLRGHADVSAADAWEFGGWMPDWSGMAPGRSQLSSRFANGWIPLPIPVPLGRSMIPAFPTQGTPPNTSHPIAGLDGAHNASHPPSDALARALSHEDYMERLRKQVPYMHAYAESQSLPRDADYAIAPAPAGRKRCWVGRPIGRILRPREDDLARGLCWLHKNARDFAHQLDWHVGHKMEWDGMKCPANAEDEIIGAAEVDRRV